MSFNNFFLAILSHKGSSFREKQRSILLKSNENLSSLEGGKFFIYYFIGDPSIDEEYVVDEDNNIVYLRIPDNYESLPQKTHGAINFVNENFRDRIKGMIKTDDDIEIDLEKVYSLLNSKSNVPYFGVTTKITNPDNLSTWHMGKCESVELNSTPVRVPISHYCAGGGYYLNLDSIEKASSSGEVYRSMIFEDASTGLVLNSHGIYPEHVNMGNFGFYWPNMNPAPPALSHIPSVAVNPLKL